MWLHPYKILSGIQIYSLAHLLILPSVINDGPRELCILLPKADEPSIVGRRLPMCTKMHTRSILFIRGTSPFRTHPLWAIIAFFWRPLGITPDGGATFGNHRHARIPCACYPHHVLQCLKPKPVGVQHMWRNCSTKSCNSIIWVASLHHNTLKTKGQLNNQLMIEDFGESKTTFFGVWKLVIHMAMNHLWGFMWVCMWFIWVYKDNGSCVLGGGQ